MCRLPYVSFVCYVEEHPSRPEIIAAISSMPLGKDPLGSNLSGLICASRPQLGFLRAVRTLHGPPCKGRPAMHFRGTRLLPDSRAKTVELDCVRSKSQAHAYVLLDLRVCCAAGIKVWLVSAWKVLNT